MRVNVFCKQADGYGRCNKKPKFLGIFKRSCPEFQSLAVCDIAERPERPDPPNHPPEIKWPENELISERPSLTF
tara:strand:- start:72150 stop:72371 length:222 start_codon:yes stop_codon:yes gene_type:complete